LRSRFLAVLCGFAALALAAPAGAQVASTVPQSTSLSGWTFDIAPYFWVMTVRSNQSYTAPGGAEVTSQVTAGINSYISNLNFATMGGAEARNGPFALMTDGLFASLSLSSDNNHFSQVTVGPNQINLSRQQQLVVGTRSNLGVWAVDGAYTVASGPWGNVDLLAGMRMLGIGSSTNYLLTENISTPAGGVALSRTGSLGLGKDYWEGVGGVRGRINIPNSNFYVPFWLDVGDGGLLTWQTYVAIAYKLSFMDVSLGYRYLDFTQGGSKAVQNFSLGGALLAATFHF
jgi:hypothetical protein